jgi:hypothetical protein
MRLGGWGETEKPRRDTKYRMKARIGEGDVMAASSAPPSAAPSSAPRFLAPSLAPRRRQVGGHVAAEPDTSAP